MKNKINSLIKITPILVIIFLFLNPFLDILASILIKEGITNYITSGIRILFCFYMFFYLIINNYEHKKMYIIYLTILVSFIILHLLFIFIYKDNLIFVELKEILTVFYFIILLLAFKVLYKDNTFNRKYLLYVYLLYLFLTFIPDILNIGFNSYWHSKVGSAGWFYSANVLGSILLILIPLIILEIKSLKPLYIIIIILVSLYVIFNIGTKTPVIGIIILIGINLLYLIYKMFKNKERKKIIVTLSVVFIMGLLSIIILPKTSFYKNIEIHLNFLKEQEVKVNSFHFIDHFIFSERLKKEEEARERFNKENVLLKFFGPGYSEKDNEINVIEIDYFDILYEEGIIGFILYFIPVIIIFIEVLRNTKIDLLSINSTTVCVLIMFLALFEGHMFITPAISVFVSLIFAINSLNKQNSVV